MTTQRNSTGIAPAACETEWTDLIHVTGDNTQVYCLTKDQLKEIELEERVVSDPIKDLLNAYSKSNETILAVKKKTWESLKNDKLIPPLKPSAEATPLKRYEAQLKRSQERYQRQLRRYRRVESDIHVIDSELKHGLLAAESRRFYARYLASLQQTLAGLGPNLGNLEVAAKQKQRVVDSEKSRVKQLQAAVESEVAFRVAQQAAPPESATTLKQLRDKAQILGEEAGLIDYVSSAELKKLADIEIKLLRLEHHIETNASQMRELRVLNLLHGATNNNRQKQQSRHALAQYEERQSSLYKTKKSLIAERDSFYSSLTERSPVEAPTQMPAMRYAQQLIEIKRTGSQGFSYIRRDTLEQLKKNWQKIPLSEMKRSLKPTRKGIAGAAKQAGKGLAENRGIKLKFADWQSREDNFLNQLNMELFKLSLNGEAVPETKQFSASAEAQLLRFSAGAQFAGEYNPKAGRVHVGAESSASYNLAQASVKFDLFLPREAGYALKLSYQGDTGELKPLHCGVFRTRFSLNIQGSVGACAMLSTKVRIETKPGEVSVGGEMNGNVFAGGMLKNEAKVSVQWAKPVSQYRLKSGRAIQPALASFKELIEVAPSASVAIGVGAGLDFNIEYSRGKFVLTLSAQLVCGPGGAGGVAVELNVGQVIELIEFVRVALEQSDFRFLEWVSLEAFDMISKFTELQLILEDTLESIASSSSADSIKLWKNITTDQKDVKEECRHILAEPTRIQIVTPLAKARVLYRICKTYWFEEDSFSWDDDELQAAACMKLLESIKSEREFIEVLRLMGMNEGKGNAKIIVSNFEKLFNDLLFQSKQKNQAFQWLGNNTTDGYAALE